MIPYLLSRLVQSVFVVFGALTIVFLLVRLSGDPTPLLVPIGASPQEISAIRHNIGLDQPLYVQYVRFLAAAVHGDFGTSTSASQPALGMVLDRLPATLRLTGLALFFMTLAGLLLGIVAAVRRNTFVDTVATSIALSGQSLPSFWIGTTLILVFSVHWHLFPSSGSGGFKSLVLPAISLASFGAGAIARVTRSSLLEVLREDYIRTARAKGQRAWIILVRHALRNALVAPLTMIGLQVSVIFGGAIVTEQVFGYPGMARLATQAVLNRDYPVVEAFVFVITLMVLLVNFIVDLLYVVVDPRIRVG